MFVVKNLNYRLNLLDALSVLYGLYTDGSIKGSIDVYKHTVYAVTETGPDGEQTERIFEKKQEALAVSRHVRSVLKLPKNQKYIPMWILRPLIK